jgi:hypothetical protein
LHCELMALWASPGGSADLLAVTLFLDRLEGGLLSAGSQWEPYYGNTELRV